MGLDGIVVWLLILVVRCGAIAELPTSEFDVVVYKSSPAGIAAAVSAAQKGKRRVALIEHH